MRWIPSIFVIDGGKVLDSRGICGYNKYIKWADSSKEEQRSPWVQVSLARVRFPKP